MESTSQHDQLPDSRLYTFLDEPREFALYFLEGQRLIQDLALSHDARGDGFAYFRDVVLSVQPMIALIKHGEQFGFYVDSAEPEFRLKIEAAHHGGIRCALVPEAFSEFPESLHGFVRLLKLFPNNRPPYESVLQADGQPLGSIVNRVLAESYQVNSTVVVSPSTDQSAMLHQLPPLPRDDSSEYSPAALERRRAELSRGLDGIFDRALHDQEPLVEAFGGIGFHLLASRTVGFECSCSKERVVAGLRLACGDDFEPLFDPGQQHLDITCEYCKSHYAISREDLATAHDQKN